MYTTSRKAWGAFFFQFPDTCIYVHMHTHHPILEKKTKNRTFLLTHAYTCTYTQTTPFKKKPKNRTFAPSKKYFLTTSPTWRAGGPGELMTYFLPFFSLSMIEDSCCRRPPRCFGCCCRWRRRPRVGRATHTRWRFGVSGFRLLGGRRGRLYFFL